MKTKIISFAIFLLLLYSCNENVLVENYGEDIFSSSEESFISSDPNYYLKKEFSLALLNVLKENKEARMLIKEEALKKINYDYDVLYYLVKDKIMSDGSTLKEKLGKYMDFTELDELEYKIPTLTIFVPTLPEDSFSAESWNVESEIPAVAIRVQGINDVPIFNYDGENWILESKYVPIHPVVVVKINERIVESGVTTRSVDGNAVNNTGLFFLDNTFDNINSKTRATPEFKYSSGSGTETDPFVPAGTSKVLNAYNIYGTTNAGWQRDYIYYGITPSSQNGPFDHQFQEHLVGFEMIGGEDALNKISDQNDPKFIKKDNALYVYDMWTDGEFEFKVKVYIGNKNATGNEYINYFRCAPEDLFHPYWKSIGGRKVTFDRMDCLKAKIMLPLFEWDLENFSSQIKIAIEEVDPSQSVVNTVSTASEFAANFGFDYTIGETTKKGLKFGASAKITRTVSYQITTSYGNDELGEVFVNFSDPIITTNNMTTEKVTIVRPKHPGRDGTGGSPGVYEYYADPQYNTKYSTGNYRLYLAPIKIY